ncbi:hypothetical protein F5Y15DRAFT_424676 [Xylariaceae sp. FL0016]|nr:hypothetical protein F5Y15DRAFT_424676 [Xylariaceae sp. FL0016]
MTGQINTGIVRSFSDDLQSKYPSNLLSRGLATKVAIDRHRENSNLASLQDQWNIFLLEGREIALRSAVPEEEAFLLERSRQLYQAWTKFCERLPEDQRMELTDEAPSLKVLHEAVEKASITWKERRQGTKTGRLKSIFTSLCSNVDAHRNLVSVIPTNDKYLSLLTGSLTAIAQASINHQELAQGVSTSLEELGHDMAYWNSLLKSGNTKIMQHCIIELYVVVFEFLTEIFSQWSKSSWKRRVFITSFDEKAFEKIFNEKRDRIKAIEVRMQRHATLQFQGEMKDHNLSTSQNQRSMELMLESALSELAVQRALLYRLGKNAHSMLLDGATNDMAAGMPSPMLLVERRTSPVSPEITRPLPPAISFPDQGLCPVAPKPGTSSASTAMPPAEAMSTANDSKSHLPLDKQEYARILRPILDKHVEAVSKVSSDTTRSDMRETPRKINSRIRDWCKKEVSDSVWVEGSPETTEPIQSTRIAAVLLAAAQNSSTLTISYFCSLEIDRKLSIAASRRKMLLDLIKSFIAQILNHSDTAIANQNFDHEALQRLPGSTTNVDEALDLLRNLRDQTPVDFLCIIEGVQELENRDDRDHTRNLKRTLKELLREPKVPTTRDTSSTAAESQNANERRVVKLFFTSSGFVDVLAGLASKGHL